MTSETWHPETWHPESWKAETWQPKIWHLRSSGWDLAKWLTAIVPVATVVGSIPLSVGTVESEGRQMKQCWIYSKKIWQTAYKTWQPEIWQNKIWFIEVTKDMAVWDMMPLDQDRASVLWPKQWPIFSAPRGRGGGNPTNWTTRLFGLVHWVSLMGKRDFKSFSQISSSSKLVFARIWD